MAKTSRRNFIKAKLLGGLFIASGLPLFSLGRWPKRELELPPLIGPNNDLDWNAVRQQFLIKEGNYFFNIASLGASPKIVVDRICESLQFNESIPREGYQERPVVRKKMAEFLNAKPSEIGITRNATESMNIIARSLDLKAGDEVILTDHEHIGGSAPWLAVQKEKDIKVKIVQLDLKGQDNLERISNSISDKTKVLSFSHITCTTGMQLPAKQIVGLCRERNIYSCIDGAQAVGLLPLDLGDLNPDFYTACGHKWLLGPKGTGILFMNEKVIPSCKAVFAGSFTDKTFDLNTQTLEFLETASRVEYGTRNAPLMKGLESAIDFISSLGIEQVMARSFELSNRFRVGLEALNEVSVLSPNNQLHSSPIVTFTMEGVNSKEAVKFLRTKKSIRLRHVYENNLNAIRASFSIFNSEEEVDFLLANIKALKTE